MLNYCKQVVCYIYSFKEKNAFTDSEFNLKFLALCLHVQECSNLIYFVAFKDFIETLQIKALIEIF